MVPNKLLNIPTFHDFFFSLRKVSVIMVIFLNIFYFLKILFYFLKFIFHIISVLK
jgi:hypothetical protein